MRQNLAAVPVVLLLSGLLGWFAAREVGSVLAISFQEKALLPEPQPSPSAPSGLAPLDPVAAIILPPGGSASEVYRYAAAELADAFQLRTGVRPALIDGSDARPGGRAVRVEPLSGAEPDRDSFRLRSDGRDLVIAGASPLASAFGMSHLAGRLAAGAGEAELAGLDTTVAPALRYRFVDLGGVGIRPDSAAWRNDDYSHHNRAFQHVIRADSPFVDAAALAEVQEQFRAYALRMAAYGYNGIVVPGFLQFVNFDQIGGGFEVYPADSEYRRRHLALRQAFGEMFRFAHGLGLAVVLNTDMVALTEPLERYFQARFGRVDVADPALWEVYRAGLAELFEAFPEVDGVMIRVGEAGTVYNLPGWNYYSELHVRSDAAVQAMLRAFDEVAAAHGRRIFFRTWTVGVGAVGDLHTQPATYERVLGGLELSNTVFSTKFVAGDFYSYLPVNPTLFTGDAPRLVELQARREYEGFAAFPNYLGPLHQQMLRRIREENPNVDGIWLWTQEGGPLRAGPWSLYPFHGFWQLIDADVYAAARLAWEPDADIATLTEGWVRRTFGADPDVVARLTEVLLRSREPVLRGLYIGEFARYDVRALGLEPPPMLWVFEWDIVTGSSAVLSAIYHTSRHNLDAAIAEGYAAADEVRRLRGLAGGIERDAVAQPELFDRLLASLAYEESLLETLAAYRQAFLSYYRWLDTGDAAAYRSWEVTRRQFDFARHLHLARYQRDLDFPAFSFFDAEVGVSHAARGPLAMWMARLFLALALVTLLVGSPHVQRRAPAAAYGFGVLWLAATRPCSLEPARTRAASDVAAAGVWPLVVVLAAHLAFSSFLSPSYLVLVGLLVAVPLTVLLAWNRERSPLTLLAAVNGPLLLGTSLLLAVVAVRGPLFFWYGFWLRDGFRVLLFTVGAAAFGWLLFVVYTALHRVCGRTAVQALGQTTVAAGAPLLALGTLLQLLGLERALTAINDELAVLPMGLSRILGITTHLGIPLALPLYVIGLGALLCALGLLLSMGYGLRAGPPPPAAAAGGAAAVQRTSRIGISVDRELL
jgi:hypothetical protein